MEIVGYFASILIGISLGLIGGGGSILTVPVLVYLFSVDAVFATVYSLFIVGITSIVGSLSYFKKGLVAVKTALTFGLPSIASVYFTRSYLVPSIPSEIISVGSYILTKNILLMLIFATLMLFASLSMIRKKKLAEVDEEINMSSNYPIVILQGILVGSITGLVGAGGGFLIIPALVNLLKLPMKKAVGTSLVIISINSIMGFLFSIHQLNIQWKLIIGIASIAIIGILIGSFLSTKIDGKKLKPLFGWFVLVMGTYIILKEIFF